MSNRLLEQNELEVFYITRFCCEAKRRWKKLDGVAGITEWVEIRVYLGDRHFATPVRMFHLSVSTPLCAIQERAALYVKLELELMRVGVDRYQTNRQKECDEQQTNG